MSSETDHSEIRSLDDLFPVDSDDTLSERSAASEGKTPVDSKSILNYCYIELFTQVFYIHFSLLMISHRLQTERNDTG